MSNDVLFLTTKVRLLEEALEDQLKFNKSTLSALQDMQKQFCAMEDYLSKVKNALDSLKDISLSVEKDIDTQTKDLTFLSIFTYFLAVNVDDAGVKMGDIARISLGDAKKSCGDLEFSHDYVFENLRF